jgi:hypothetical protein
MPYAIELFFDEETETAVRRVWAALAERGIAPYLHESLNRPHVSLAVYDALDLDLAATALEAFAATTTPLPISLASWGLFPTAPEPVVFAAPVVTGALLALHERACAQLASVAQGPSAYYLPGRWTPHCSLAVHFPPERVMRAVELCRGLPLPLAGRFEAIGVVETRPARPLFSYPLAATNASY